MRGLIIFLLGGLILSPLSTEAFPQAVAKLILGRPVNESALKKEVEHLDTFISPIIAATDAITVVQVEVGKPKVTLSVLVIEPRHYGFKVQETIETKNDRDFSYSLAFNIDGDVIYEPTEAILDSFREESEDADSFDLNAEQISKILAVQARAGGMIHSTDQPKTVFLLLGYGVPKQAAIPMALKLADHGIRSVIPDLRGQGDSGGKGVTWGKHEPDDLAALLSELQRKGTVVEETVAVMGVSYGAVMASLWAARDSRIETLLLAAPYSRADTTIVAAYQEFIGATKLPFSFKEKTLIRGTEIAARRLQSSWEDLSTTAAIGSITKPVLFIASSGDEVIPVEEVSELVDLSPAGSQLHVCDDLPHVLLGMNFTELETIALDWFAETGFLEKAE
ncbi:MAG: alpha/beta hydrolase [Verrucomicrobiota bacterium]